MAGLALASSLIQLLTHLIDLSLLLLAIIPVVLLLILDKAASNTLALREGLLEEVVGELHVVTIIVLHVVFNILRFIIDGAVLIREDADLDTGARGGAHGPSEELNTIIISNVELLALNELRGIHVAVLLHVLNVLALSIAGAGVHVLALPGILVLLLLLVRVIVFGRLSCLLIALVTGVAVLLLGLLLIAEGRLEVGLHVNDVLAVVVVAGGAAGVRAEAEDDKALGGEDGVHALSSSAALLAVVRLDELALLELDGVAAEVDLLLLVLPVELTKSLGVGHELRVHLGLARVTALLGGEGAGGAVADGGAEEGKGELHGRWID
mmetsp:Transcript_6171/g.13547  ORF Transcript_6171/g.13547 Transcript_6171/m.13547 type:complete len:324 (-) Transcript_6171:32-1003(-)